MFSSIFFFTSTALLLSITIFAAPTSLYERDGSEVNWGSTPSSGLSEVQKLNYVLLLESAHSALYSQVLANYSDYDFVNAGLKDPFYSTIEGISSSTAGNVKSISNAIQDAGETVPETCTFAWPGLEGTFGWALFTEQFEGTHFLTILCALTSRPHFHVTPTCLHLTSRNLIPKSPTDDGEGLLASTYASLKPTLNSSDDKSIVDPLQL